MENPIAIGASPVWDQRNGNHPQWTVGQLQDELILRGAGGKPTRDLIFLRCPDREYWLYRALEDGYYIRATHPIELGPDIGSLQLRENQLGIFYEYISPFFDLQDAFEKIGGVLYFEARCSTFDPIALEQAFLELMDWLRLHMEAVDEIFARTRNLSASSPRSDSSLIHLKLANGIEGHCFFHAFTAEQGFEITFYGPSGAISWDGGIEGIGVDRAESPQGIARATRIAEWVDRAARFERAITYGESKKL